MDKPQSCKISPQAGRLSRALQKRGVPHKLESFDDCKQSGIAISWAKLNLKISTRYYLPDPNQLFSDFEANVSSPDNLTSTIKIPNEKVDTTIWKN